MHLKSTFFLNRILFYEFDFLNSLSKKVLEYNIKKNSLYDILDIFGKFLYSTGCYKKISNLFQLFTFHMQLF